MSGAPIATGRLPLDDRSTPEPNVEVWCAERRHWVTLPNMAVSLERE